MLVEGDAEIVVGCHPWIGGTISDGIVARDEGVILELVLEDPKDTEGFFFVAIDGVLNGLWRIAPEMAPVGQTWVPHWPFGTSPTL